MITLSEALGLWRGPAYAGFEATGFGTGESRRLEELRLAAVEDRIDAELEVGRAAQAVAELEALVGEQPLRERLWSLLVLALYRAGRQGDALAAFGRAWQILVEELGIEPGVELRRLHAGVLAQDPTLLTPAAAPTVPAELVPPPGPFVGRDQELGVLRDAADRAAAGQPVTVMVRGPRGSGAARLAAELAVELAERGFRVEHLRDSADSPEPAAIATMTVVTSGMADLAGWVPPQGPRLTVVVARPSAPAPRWAQVLDLPPLDRGAVRAIVASYVDESIVDEVLPQVLRESQGIPGRVHDAAVGLARRRVVAQVEQAAARTGQRQGELGAARAALREGVNQFRDVLERQAPVAADVCPWRGLASYEVADAVWFAGRERLVAELLVRLFPARLLAVVGTSGSGKSSAVKAGLLASLEAGALPGSGGWVRLLMRPGPHPMRELARVALRGADPPARDRAADLLQRLVYGTGDVATGRLVLVVDQLEEVWTVCADAAERTAFLDALAELVEAEALCTVVLVVRADFLGELADQPVLAQAVADATVLVGALTASEVGRAVEHPAERAGLRLDVALADALVVDAGGEPGSLPLLSTALVELWQHRDGVRLTLAGYVAAGGIRGAIGRIADRAYEALEPADQAAARVLLLRLAGPGEGDAVTRRRVPVAELAALPDPRVATVVEPLAQARLLTVSAGHVEVAHEALFRQWPRLRAWLADDTAGRAVQRRLSLAAAEWDAGEREPTELWRGTRLAAGADFVASHPDEVTETELAFLAAGQAQHDAERRAAEDRAATATRQNRRLRWLLTGLATVLALALVAGGVAVSARSQAQQQARLATARELATASGSNLQSDPELSTLLALAAVRQTRIVDGTVLPEAEEALHAAVSASRITLTVPGIGGNVDWSPDGRLFVATGTDQTGLVELRDAHTGRVVRSFHGHTDAVKWAVFSPNGATFATSGHDGALRVWDTSTGKPRGVLKRPGYAVGPSYSPNGHLVAAAWLSDIGDRISILDLATHQAREIPISTALHGLGTRPIVTAFSPDGTRLAISIDNAVAVLDLASGRLLHGLRGHTAEVTDVDWSPDGRWITTTSVDRTARIWDARTGAFRYTLNGHNGQVWSADWSRDSTRLVTGSDDGTAKLWQITDAGPREQFTLSARAHTAGGVAISPDGTRVLTADTTDQAVKMWDVSAGGTAEWANLQTIPDTLSGVAFIADGRVITSTGNGSIAVWDAATGAQIATLGAARSEPPPGQVDIAEFRVAASPDGQLIASTDAGGKTVVWNLATGRAEFSAQSKDWVADLGWSPDGQFLAMGGEDAATVRIVNRSGTEMAHLSQPGSRPVGNLQFSPDGRLIAAGGVPQSSAPNPATDKVYVWDWNSGTLVRTLPAMADAAVAFNRTGSRIAVANRAAFGEIWDVRTGTKLATLKGHTGSVAAITYSPDDSLIATAGLDGTVRLWKAETGQGILALRGHTSRVHSLQFSPDGSKLASASADGTVRIWAIKLDDLIRIADKGLTRDLTNEECLQYLHRTPCPQTAH